MTWEVTPGVYSCSAPAVDLVVETRKFTLNGLPARCAFWITMVSVAKSDVRTALVRIDRGDEVRVRALTGPEAVARIVSLRR